MSSVDPSAMKLAAASATHGGQPAPLSQRMFEKYDADKSGKIDEKEFRHLLYDTGQLLTDTEVKVAMQSMATDGSGQIPYEEFKKWWATENRYEQLKIPVECCRSTLRKLTAHGNRSMPMKSSTCARSPTSNSSTRIWMGRSTNSNSRTCMLILLRMVCTCVCVCVLRMSWGRGCAKV
jgi:hypothetical protein